MTRKFNISNVISRILFLTKILTIKSQTCEKKTRQEMLGAPAECNLSTTEGCDGHQASITYSSGTTFVVCEVSHMCILIQEEFMFGAWGVTKEEQLEDATFEDATVSLEKS